MLNGRPTQAEIEATVHRTIVELIERSGRAARPFDEADELVSLGLSSLDLAALVAKLQRQWRIDPFLEARTFTEVVTVGDLCRAYWECIGAA
jgi:acyl carrier protein